MSRGKLDCFTSAISWLSFRYVTGASVTQLRWNENLKKIEACRAGC